VPPLLAYAFLSASVDVYAGHQEQSLDPIAVGAISFTLAALVFLVLPIRYFLMIAVCWAVLPAGHSQRLTAAFVPAAVIALIGVVGPNYLVQRGLGHTEPITVSLFQNLAPVFTYLLQLLDSRLQPSAVSLAGVLGITALVAAGVVGRGRHEARAGPRLAPAGQPAPGPEP